MKKRLNKILPYFLTLLCMLHLLACKKLDEKTQFTMPYDESVIIPSSTGLNLPFNFFSPDVQTNSESTFSVNATRKDLIELIRLQQLELNLVSPSSGNFDFLKSIEIFLSADGLSEIRLAWKDNVSKGSGTTLVLDLSAADLKEYIKKDVFKLRVSTVTDQILNSDQKIDIHAEFFVDATLLKQK